MIGTYYRKWITQFQHVQNHYHIDAYHQTPGAHSYTNQFRVQTYEFV